MITQVKEMMKPVMAQVNEVKKQQEGKKGRWYHA
jgi:hypothetical protein